MEELHQRLLKRATDTIEVIDARMQRAAHEVSHWDGYEYVLVNDDVEECFTSVCTILQAERLKRSRQTGLIGFIRTLIKSGYGSAMSGRGRRHDWAGRVPKVQHRTRRLALKR